MGDDITMRLTRYNTKLLSVVAVTIFLLTLGYSGSALPAPANSGAAIPALPSTRTIHHWQPLPAENASESGTSVWWHQEKNSTSDEWTWNNKNWIFGPHPTFEIYHQNGTLIDKDSYILLNEKVTIHMIIPKSVFTQGAQFGRANLNGWYLTPEENFSAWFDIGFDATNDWQPFYAQSSTHNSSDHEGGPPDIAFLQLVGEECSNYSDINNLYVDLVVNFTDTTPLGLYDLRFSLQDREWNEIGSFNYFGPSDFNLVAIGIPPSQAWRWSWGGSYTLQKLDLAGEVIYSVSRNTDFIMRFNITGQHLGSVILSFPFPGGMYQMVNTSGRHTETIHTHGGWEYDPNLNTYFWNATADVTVTTDSYGPYTERQWVELPKYIQVNYTKLTSHWDNNTNSYIYNVVNTSDYVERHFYYIYNVTTGIFESYLGYSYWGYPLDHYDPNVREQEIYVMTPLNESSYLFYELNDTLCTSYMVGQETIVEFVGHFTDMMPKTTSDSPFKFETRVMDDSGVDFQPATWGKGARQDASDFDLARQVTIDSPVLITKLLHINSTEYSPWLFHVEKGEPFEVYARLQGGSDLADDIDGIQLHLEAFDGYWTENESQYSTVLYEILYDTNGTPTLTAFNWTTKSNYTYGYYWDWVEVNRTGWYYGFNPSKGVWEWMYGNYTDWQWTRVKGWHWQDWYYNQLTDQWQTDWFPQRSAEATIPPDFAQVFNYSMQSDGGDRIYTFTVNMSENVPDASYYWDVTLLNNTWYIDHSSEMGLHDLVSWANEWVWSFNYNNQKVYTERVNQNQLAFFNASLSSDFLFGKESPYIVIDGQKLPIKTFERYDPYSGTSITSLFLHDHYDDTTQHDVYRYELINGTSVFVTFINTIQIYRVNTLEGESFLTTNERHYDYFDGMTHYNVWIDLDGDAHCSSSMAASINLVDKVVLNGTPNGMLIQIGPSETLRIQDYTWSSADDAYVVNDIYGHHYVLNHSESLGEMIYYNGTWRPVSGPYSYYGTNYNGTLSILLAEFSKSFWFYEDNSGIRHEMPYPGANAQWWMDLDEIESKGGVVPTTYSVLINGTEYPVYNTTLTDYWVDYDGSSYHLIRSFEAYTRANVTDIWNPAGIGFQTYFGYYDEFLNFHKLFNISFDSASGPNPHWDDVAQSDVINLLNGTTWRLNHTYVLTIYEYNTTLGTIYSRHGSAMWVGEGNSSFLQLTALNGSLYNFTDYEEFRIINRTLLTTYYNSTDSSDYYSFMGVAYKFHSDGDFRDTYKVLNATYTGELFMDAIGETHGVYEFDYHGAMVRAYPSREMVHRHRLIYGYAVIYGPVSLDIPSYKNYYEFIIGNPQWGMWGIQAWTINEANGALDLDGNLETTDDQYYILEEYSSTDSWTHNWNTLDIGIIWDPNRTQYGDEINVHSWLGLNTFTWSYEWNETFYWYHASDMTPLNATEMQRINDTLFRADGDPQPGYWDIAWMFKNVTWQDILQQAQENGWDWISSNTQTWTWMAFGIDQNYGTSYKDGDVDHWLGINLHYEFSGLMLWKDMNNDSLMDVDLNNPPSSELTHFFIPDSVGNVSFVTPGMLYGDLNTTGHLELNLTDEVTWGVSFMDVNGTVYPFSSYGYWDWYDGVIAGSDLRTFDERPSKISIDEISFLVHFQGHLNLTDSLNNYATIKVDNYVGNWDVDMLGGRSNLVNRSLALNYFADVNMNDFAFKANGTMTGQDMVVGSDVFSMETANAKFAEMIMGGVTYDWGKNTTAPYDVVSYTTPAGTFRTAYQSESGQSATSWSITSTQFYVSIGFLHWDGYSVFQDPVFVAYVSNTGTSNIPGAVTFAGFSMDPMVPTSSDSVTIGVDIYSQIPIDQVNLEYSLDQNNWESVPMNPLGGTRWTGNIPPYPDGTQVFYRVAVTTQSGTYYSTVFSYIVGQGAVTTTTPNEVPGDESGDVFMMLAVVAPVVIIVIILALRRRR